MVHGPFDFDTMKSGVFLSNYVNKKQASNLFTARIAGDLAAQKYPAPWGTSVERGKCKFNCH
jgi:hypothetical protein